MNNRIEIKINKILKLTNALIQYVDIKCDNRNVEHSIIQMDNYLKSKGATPIGPLIQKTEYSVNEEGQLDIKVCFMRQANNFIHNVEAPYTMESVLRVRNCMYARYTGPEEKLKLAYDKINVTAFEEDIELSNSNYTIFVDKQDDNIVADIFVEKKTDE
ncbi:MAG: hypothetical protein Q4D76_14305 [Oscillospiraceae bacterium]|nr:hypothetical protein [Oscillospiraceae bacterium]